MSLEFLYYGLMTLSAVFVLHKAYVRLQLSRAKHPSIRGHSKMSRRIARAMRSFDYAGDRFLRSDGAPDDIVMARRAALSGLQTKFIQSFPSSLKFAAAIEDCFSDARFTKAYRVPFPYRESLDDVFKATSVAVETSGVRIRDIDDNWRYDLTASYGVNVFGYDFYKDCMETAFAKVRELGPLLGPHHPLTLKNAERLKRISGLDEVSFHMSGTEAVMQAVRSARYQTGRRYLVRLCGAYHGWWDGVQPGVGNQRNVDDVYTLRDLDERTLRILETRKDIACVLINPLQALHPNGDTGGDASLIASNRSADFNREKYTAWLKAIRDVCTRRDIVLIFDEVFTGFRLGYRGAQEYFGIQADMVTYGKTLGGGLPVGVVCGARRLMKRYKDEAPANISFARGTFNAHPYVMAAMDEFLTRIDDPDIRRQYETIEAVWDRRVHRLNDRMVDAGLPVKIASMHTVLTILYTVPSRYNWMYQFYLRAEGLELSWIGSGRMIMSFNFSDDDFEEVAERMIRAAQQMQHAGWWWQSPDLTNTSIKRQMLRDMAAAKFPFLNIESKPSDRNFADHVPELKKPQ